MSGQTRKGKPTEGDVARIVCMQGLYQRRKRFSATMASNFAHTPNWSKMILNFEKIEH